MLEPADLVRLASGRGVETLALTDHDTLAGSGDAIAAGERSGVRVVPSIELNTESAWGDVHVLGYLLDPSDATLEDRLRWLRENRGRRIELMIENLNRLGYPVSLERVIAIAKGDAALRAQEPLPVGRPHLAQALVEAGHVRSYDEAFETLISRDSPAYVARVGLTPSEAVKLIVARGGAASLAHPGTVNGLRELVPELVNEGLTGMEVYYPQHTAAWTAELRTMADAFGLIATGGSDFHGRGEHGGPLGGSYVPDDSIAALERSATIARQRKVAT